MSKTFFATLFAATVALATPVLAAGTEYNQARAEFSQTAEAGGGNEYNVARGTEYNVARGTEYNVARGAEYNVARGAEYNVARGNEYNVARGNEYNQVA